MIHDRIIINSTGQIEKVGPGISRKDLNNLRSQIEKYGLLTTKYYMNEAEYKDILSWGNKNNA